MAETNIPQFEGGGVIHIYLTSLFLEMLCNYRRKWEKAALSRQRKTSVGVSLLEVRKTNTQSHPTPRLVEKSTIAEVPHKD